MFLTIFKFDVLVIVANSFLIGDYKEEKNRMSLLSVKNHNQLRLLLNFSKAFARPVFISKHNPSYLMRFP
ncbi:hypothetical protein MACH16_04740 [Marinomonas pontica]|uniref:Uncharacterized protein n=1 Tax=Marinomonas pontica TaxID=264739 RepID=A0ABM8FAB1_9GAMM|nr:hypothetical protein MACH16_04740 [Marinomonas pontica]